MVKLLEREENQKIVKKVINVAFLIKYILNNIPRFCAGFVPWNILFNTC